MSSFAPIGLLISLLSFIVPIVVVVLLLLWVYQLKTNSETQVAQNKKIIQLLEKLTNQDDIS